MSINSIVGYAVLSSFSEFNDGYTRMVAFSRFRSRAFAEFDAETRELESLSGKNNSEHDLKDLLEFTVKIVKCEPQSSSPFEGEIIRKASFLVHKNVYSKWLDNEFARKEFELKS